MCVGEPTNVPAVNDWLNKSEETWNQAHTHLQHAIRRQKEQADRHRRTGPDYQPGQWVWLSTRDLCLRFPCKKAQPKPADSPSEEGEERSAEQGPPPIVVEGEEARVHELLDSRRQGRTLQYLVDWEGYGPEERSCVNSDDILDPNLVEEFHRAHLERPAPLPWGRLHLKSHLRQEYHDSDSGWVF